MPSREPIHIQNEPQRLSDAVFKTLHKAILDGQLAPGEWLRQEALANELGVSQITVREALNKLVSEGLCIRVPYKGVRVISLSMADLEDIYEIRRLLEGLAAEVAAGRITPEELAQMRAILPDTVVDEDPASIDRAREANREFHEIAIRASGRQFLIQILRQVWGWIDPLTVYARTARSERGARLRQKLGQVDKQQHTALLEALEAGDGIQARRVVEAYVIQAWHNLRAELSGSIEKGGMR